MNTSKNSTTSFPAFALNKNRTNAGMTEKSTCISYVPLNYPTSRTKIGKHGPLTSVAHTKPCRTIRSNPSAGHIILPIWLRSKLSNLRNMLTQPLPPLPPQQEYPHLKRPLPDTAMDVAMIEATLLAVDVVVVLAVDVAIAEIHKTQGKISPEILTLGVPIARDLDMLQPTAIRNSKIPVPHRPSRTGAPRNRLLRLHNI